MRQKIGNCFALEIELQSFSQNGDDDCGRGARTATRITEIEMYACEARQNPRELRAHRSGGFTFCIAEM